MFTKALDSLKSDICSKIEVAITGVQTDIAAVKEKLTSSVAALQRSLNLQDDRLKDIEKSATEMSDKVTALETTVSKLQSELRDLQQKCEDLECRSRRNNIRLVGIAEGAEGTSPTDFVSTLLYEVLSLQEKPLLDRANRSLRPGQAPRPFIVRIHYYHIRELILRRARQVGPLSYNGRPIYIFPDITTDEAKKRRTFAEVRKQLRDIEGTRFWLSLP